MKKEVKIKKVKEVKVEVIKEEEVKSPTHEDILINRRNPRAGIVG